MKSQRSKTKTCKDSMFALDIGTKSVVGMIGHIAENKLVIEHAAVVFHESRAMFDGQVHDIETVSRVIGKVRNILEEKTGNSLTQVTIAAAGRALKTVSMETTICLDELEPVTQTHIHQVELEALEKAQTQLEAHTTGEVQYFCVGHTVNEYALDGALITHPAGHHGSRLTVKLIATFLPKMVVDSLYTAVSKADLEVSYMTLEPIAAIEVAVPRNARLLNIALADVGAGTSDIAITRDGTIIAYGMSSVAGDEITEMLAKEEMLDFDQAEALKCELSKGGRHQYRDILGIDHESEAADLLEKIQPAIELIATEISDIILKENGKKPSAVFLIGGGSIIPGLSRAISQRLDIPSERVVVRERSQIAGLEDLSDLALGPEGITPIGILQKALLTRKNDFLEVEVNGQPVRLFQTRVLRVKDALAAMQYDPRLLMPKRGKSLVITINGDEKTLAGEYGSAATILVDRESAHLETEIRAGSQILIKAATLGPPRKAKLEDVIPAVKKCQVDGKTYPLVTNIQLNDTFADHMKIELSADDRIGYTELHTPKQLMEQYGLKINRESSRLDGKPLEPDSILEDGSIILTHFNETQTDESIERNTDTNHELKNESALWKFRVKLNGKENCIQTNKRTFLFVDLFEHFDFDRRQAMGKLILKHNDQPAVYTAKIAPDDEIWIYWEQEHEVCYPELKETVTHEQRR